MPHTAEKICSMLSPELQLVLLCSRLEIQEKEQAAIRRLMARTLDWNFLLMLAVHHRLYPLMYRYLNAMAQPAVPEELVAALRQQSQQNIAGTLQMTAELVKILRMMEQNGLRAVVMKGFPLAKQLYGDMTLRPSHDLDILVWPDEVDKARRLIEAQGYVWEHPLADVSSAGLQKWMKTNQHIVFWHPHRKICLELHWRLDCHGMDIALAQAEKNLTTMQIAGQSISVLGREELLLYLVLHGAVHAWFRLKWLCDIDVMIRQGNFSWDALYRLADSLGVNSVLNQAIILSRELLATPVPQAVATIVAKDMRANDLAILALRFTTNYKYKPKSLKETAYLFYLEKKYRLYLKSAGRAQLAFFSRCFLPAKEDLELISLPANLYFIYYMVSPLTWFCRRVRNIAGRYNLW